MSLTKEKAKTRLAVLLVIIIIIAFLLRLKYNMDVAIRQVDKVNTTINDLAVLGDVLTDIHTLESSQNAYILTGSDNELYSYNQSRDSLKQNMHNLFFNPKSNSLKNNETNLEDLLNKKIADSKSLIEIRNNFGIDSAVSAIRGGRGELEMNSIRIKIKSLQEKFKNKIEVSNAIRRGLVTKVATEFILFAFLLLIILLLTYLFFLKESRIRRKHEHVLEFNGALIGSIKDPVITISPEFLITNWNTYAEELYGFKEQSVIGKSLTEVLNIEIINGDINGLKDHLKSEGVWKGEMIHTAYNNTTLQVNATISNIKSSSKNATGYVALFIDITRQKEMENKLIILTNNLEREVERKAAELNSVFDRITDAFFALDSDWNYTYLNKKAEELHEKTEAELKGKSIWEVYKDITDEPLFGALLEARRTMQPLKLQLKFHKDGRWFENYIYPSSDGISIYYHDITAKKKAELELSSVLEKLNSHITNTPLAVVEFDKDLQVVKWSNKAEHIFGWKSEQICDRGFTLFDMFAEEDVPFVKDSINSLFQNKKSDVLELRNINNKGEYIYCEWYNSIISKNSETSGIMALVQDVSERKKIEIELQESESKFKSLVEESLVGVYIVQNQKLSYVNPRFCEIFGFDDDKLILGEDIITFLGEDLQKGVLNNYSMVSPDGKKSLHFEFDAIHKSGKKIKLEVFGSFLKYNGKNAVIGTVIDITEKSKTERELLKSNERFELVAKATNDAIWDWDMETDKLSGNERFYYFFGLANGETISSKVFYSKLHPDDMKPIVANLKSAIIEKKPYVTELFRFRKTDGSFRYINDRSYILYDNEGNPKRMLGAMQDVSEQRLIQQNLLNEKQLSDLIINGLPGIFFVINQKHKVYRWNKNLEELLGITNIGNKTLDLENFFTENENYAFLNDFNPHLENPEFKTEVKIRNGEGKEVPYIIIKRLIIYEGEPCIMVVGLDISERMLAQKKLEESENNFRTLIDQASDGIFITDNNENFIDVNSIACKLTGFNKDELLSMTMPQVLFTENKIPVHIPQKQSQAFLSLNLLKSKEGNFTYVEVSSNHLNDGRYQLIVRDITKRRKSEEALKLSENKYRLIFEQNPMPMWMLSQPENNFLAVNAAAIDFYGYSKEEFLKMNVNDISINMNPVPNPLIDDSIVGIKNSGIWQHKKRNGEEVMVSILAHDIIFEGKPAKLELANDITEKIEAEENLKNSHTQLRELAKHLQTIRESERLHMSREIHDELGQQLTGLKMDISWLTKHIVNSDEAINEKFREIISLVDKSVKTVRRLSTQLRPSILDDLGLVAAMEWQSEDFQKRTEISTTFISEIDDLVIPPELSINIFRIYQESLTNVMRHANASKVNAALLFENNHLTLSIKDNGVGFDKNRIGTIKTLGLLGMKERTLMMKGIYEISSEPGKGTSVVIIVPLDN